MTDRPTWKVVRNHRSWLVRRNGSMTAVSRHEDRDAAVREARLLAVDTAPSQLVVHAEDGRVIWAEVFSRNGNGSRPASAPAPGDQPADA